MTEVLALDPSISSSGVALFRDGVLVAAGRLTTLNGGCSPAQRALDQASLVRDWLALASPVTRCLKRRQFVSEWPQVYRASRAKGDPNDLLAMCAVVGAAAALLQPEQLVTYTPAEWMKLPKSTKHAEAFTSARGQRIMGRLSDAECALVPRYHDAVDAVGIGLKYLDRLEPKRVYPGAT